MRFCVLTIFVLTVAAAPSVPIETPCVGDCNGDGLVTVDEILAGVSMALPGNESADCPGFPTQRVEVYNLVAAVRHALYGCPAITPSTPGTLTLTPTPTATPIADPVLHALTEVVDDMCLNFGPIFDVWVGGRSGSYSFYCMPGPGHETEASLKQLSSPDAAAMELDRVLAAHNPDRSAPYDFHGFPAAQWERDDPHLGGTSEYHGVVWAVGCWLVDVEAFDDTHYWLLSPMEASEKLFTELVETGVVGGCPSGE